MWLLPLASRDRRQPSVLQEACAAAEGAVHRGTCQIASGSRALVLPKHIPAEPHEGGVAECARSCALRQRQLLDRKRPLAEARVTDRRNLHEFHPWCVPHTASPNI